MANAAGFAILTLTYWLVVRLTAAGAVELPAWTALYIVCAAVAATLWCGPAAGWPRRRWLKVAFYCPFLALIFYGANGALDALHGEHRLRARPEEAFGGLELWHMLFPGATAVAVAGWFRTLVAARVRGVTKQGR
jgi:hypothetical protein